MAKLTSKNKGDQSVRNMQAALYKAGFGTGSYNTFVDGIVGKNTKIAIQKAIDAGYDYEALKQGKLVKKTNSTLSKRYLFDEKGRYIGQRGNSYTTNGTYVSNTTYKNVEPGLSKEYYLYNSANNKWELKASNAMRTLGLVGRSVVNKVTGSLGMGLPYNDSNVDISSDEVKRQAYAALLTGKGISTGAYERLTNERTAGTDVLGKLFNHPLIYLVNNASGVTTDDKGNIIIDDIYDFHTNHDELNQARKARGKKERELGPMLRLETWLSKDKGAGHYNTRIVLTPQDIQRYDREYEAYKNSSN